MNLYVVSLSHGVAPAGFLVFVGLLSWVGYNEPSGRARSCRWSLGLDCVVCLLRSLIISGFKRFLPALCASGDEDRASIGVRLELLRERKVLLEACLIETCRAMLIHRMYRTHNHSWTHGVGGTNTLKLLPTQQIQFILMLHTIRLVEYWLIWFRFCFKRRATVLRAFDLIGYLRGGDILTITNFFFVMILYECILIIIFILNKVFFWCITIQIHRLNWVFYFSTLLFREITWHVHHCRACLWSIHQTLRSKRNSAL